MFRREHGHFPDRCDDPALGLSGQVIGAGLAIDQLLAPYLVQIPRDPRHNPNPIDTPSSDQFFYAYDYHHDASLADCSEDSGMDLVVITVNRAETDQIPENRVTCTGNQMQIATAHHQILLQSYPSTLPGWFPRQGCP